MPASIHNPAAKATDVTRFGLFQFKRTIHLLFGCSSKNCIAIARRASDQKSRRPSQVIGKSPSMLRPRSTGKYCEGSLPRDAIPEKKTRSSE
jgi:hypothetical protein